MNDRLLTEVQRQQKYLDRLPSGYVFPLFNAKQALLSQRASGYRDTASAAREIVDNSIESGATMMHIVLNADRDGNTKGSVKQVAFIDNGPGMLPRMARYALSWGGGTHFDDPDFIGRFGFGLPNASINQCKVTEVYTRTAGQTRFTKAWLNIADYTEHGVQVIPEPVEEDLPPFVQQYLKRVGLNLEHGTVVIWSEPDRLSYKKVSTLKEHLINDFGITYRYLLSPRKLSVERFADLSVGRDAIIIDHRVHVNPSGKQSLELIVDGKLVNSVDPLFLMPGELHHLAEKEGGAILVYNGTINVCYFVDTKTGEHHLERTCDLNKLEADSREILVSSAIHVRVARFPYGFAQESIDNTEASKRLEIRKKRHGMSFVRGGREIQTTDAFPQKSKDRASGLGTWPSPHQSYGNHWGVEVRFQPELDDVFGITNDKQGVRPIEDFWRVLVKQSIDEIVSGQQKILQIEEKARKLKKATLYASETMTTAEEAARDADAAEGRRLPVPEEKRAEINKRFEALIQSKVTQEEPEEKIRQVLEKTAKRRPYQITYEDHKHGPFYEPDWSDLGQVIVKLNRQHPFYTDMYCEMANLPGGEKVKNGIDLLLITLARAELHADAIDMRNWYEVQREDRWSNYLKNAMKHLQYAQPNEEIDEVEEDQLIEDNLTHSQ